MVNFFFRQKVNAFLVVLVGLMLSACTISPNESVVPTPFEDPLEQDVEINQVSLGEEQVSTVENLPLAIAIADETVEQEDTLIEPEENFVKPPVFKTSLQATNPSMVNLASGEIQFVELFAFW